MAHADVAIGIDHAFVGEDAVGDDNLADVELQVVHGMVLQRELYIGPLRPWRLLCASCLLDAAEPDVLLMASGESWYHDTPMSLGPPTVPVPGAGQPYQSPR